MDFQLTFAESALVDLEEILTYSWTNFPDTAERLEPRSSTMLNS